MGKIELSFFSRAKLSSVFENKVMFAQAPVHDGLIQTNTGQEEYKKSSIAGVF